MSDTTSDRYPAQKEREDAERRERAAAAEEMRRPNHPQAIYNAALAIAQQQSKLPIGKVQTRYFGKDEAGAAVAAPAGDGRELPVRLQPTHKSFLLTAHDPTPVPISAGEYRLTELVYSETGRRDKTDQHRFACTCSLASRPISTTVSFPDLQHLFEYANVPQGSASLDQLDRMAPDKFSQSFTPDTVMRALNAAGIRSQDNFLGRVTVQLVLEVVDPQRLVATLQETQRTAGKGGGAGQGSLSEVQARKFQQTATADNVMVGGRRRKLFERMLGLKDEAALVNSELLEPTETITFADLYPHVRFEMMRVIAMVIGTTRADDLYTNPNAQRDLEDEIKRQMSQTLEAQGLALSRVSALQFLSDRFESKLKLEEEVAFEDNVAGLKRRAMENARDLAEAELDHTGSFDRARLEQERLTDAQKSRLLDQQQAADVQRRQLAEEADRDRRVRDASADVQIDRERRSLDHEERLRELEYARVGLELHRERRRIDADIAADRARLLAEMPPDRLLLILIDQNPSLQQAFIAAKQAEGHQERAEAEKMIVAEITRLEGEHRGDTQQLLVEAIKQIGPVTGHLIDAQRGNRRDARPVRRRDEYTPYDDTEDPA